MNKSLKKIISAITLFIFLMCIFTACSVKPYNNGEEDVETGTNVELNYGEEQKKEEIKNEETKETDKIASDVNDKKASDKEENKDTSENKPIKEPEKEVSSKPEYSLSQIMSNIISVIPENEHNMTMIPKELYKDMYGIDSSQFEDVLVYGSMMSVKANEIILIKLKDETQSSQAEKLLEERKSQVYKTWEQYLPEQFEMVKQAKIKINGKYAALIIAPYVEKVSGEFMKF